MSGKTSSAKAPSLSQNYAERAKKLTSRLKVSRLVRFGLLFLAPFLILEGFFFSDILRNHNYLEVFPHELILPSLVHVITAMLIALTVYFVKRPVNIAAKLATASILGLFMVDYDNRINAVTSLFRTFLPILPETGKDIPLISLLLIIALAAISFWVGRRVEQFTRARKIDTTSATVGIFIVIGFIFGGQALKMAHVLPVLVRESRVQAPLLEKPQNSPVIPAADKPDIYYIVLDRYTNNEVLQNQFAFDNTPFTDFLRGNNFHVNDKAYANYPYTTMSVASTLNGAYTNKFVEPYKDSDVQSRTLYHNLIWQSSVIKALKADGYKYYNIGSWYGATYKAPLADRDYMWQHMLTFFGTTKKLRGMEVKLTQTPYNWFGKVNDVDWWPLKIQQRDEIAMTREQLNILDTVSTKETPGGRFIFSHILVPHDPFLFNADGSLATSSGTDSIGSPIKQKYTQQVQFINTQIQQLIDNIQKQSEGKAVIVLNSDEGPYPSFMNDTFKQPAASSTVIDGGSVKEDMRQWSDEWLQMKFGILQAVHIPKATAEDLEHLSSVNVFRIILNRYLGYGLDYLPQCHFGVSEGGESQFNYADLTPKFQPTPDASCNSKQSLPTK